MYSYANRFCDGFSTFGRNPLGGSILFIVGIILIAVLVFVVLRKGGVVSKTEAKSPLELLQKRFVNGEISQEEYLEKKDVLKG